ncbi:PQQ-binding-like beta-propeller repeat protein [Streptomyces sannanensis]|uniref:PQQ-binding-like beta-propeller repeat protein n=1 Tax=Streptomyces sannanensis TaxID=285536 RepID=A0ABP6SB11_9ACTN
MTQPPSPYPPQGGFGAPQDPSGEAPGFGAPQNPPPGGFGAPQPPGDAAPGQAPVTPGYGQPQAPVPGYGYAQTPPGGQPGHGYPQGGPYAQPSGPYGQYPPQQFPGAPATAAGGNGPFKRRTGAIIGAAVAGLLVVGCGVWLATSGGADDPKKPVAGGSDAPTPTGSASVDQGDGSGDGRKAAEDLNAGRKPGEAKVLYLHMNHTALPESGGETYGPWFSGDTVVKAMFREVTGYSAADGKQKWSVPLATPVCAAPLQPTADGKIVIGVKDGNTRSSECSLLQQIDLTTGKAGWKKEIPEENTFDIMTSLDLTIAGDTVTASRLGTSSAFSVTDGRKLFGEMPGACKFDAFAGGEKLVGVAGCTVDGEPNAYEQVQEVDPATGKAKWTFEVPKGWKVERVYSVSPVVLYLTNEEKKAWNISTLTSTGVVRSQLATKDSFEPQCGWALSDRSLQGCTGAVADGNTLYLPTKPKGSSPRTNEIVAFDLDTGKEKWRSPADEGRTMLPLKMEGANLLAYTEPAAGKGGAVTSIAPSGGSPKTVLQNPASTAGIEKTFHSKRIDYVDGRFFILNSMILGKKDTEEKALMAFGK